MRWPVAVFIMLVTLIPQVLPAADLCPICKNPISGGYVKFSDGSKFCYDCVKKYPACDICGKPTSSYTMHDAKKICIDCLSQTERCSFCGDLLIGMYSYFADQNIKLCRNCADTVKVCSLCGRPDRNMVEIDDKHICTACLDKIQRCYICGKPLTGRYVWFGSDRSKMYCSDCAYDQRRCADCGAPVAESGRKLEDGRVLCAECYGLAYFQPEQVGAIKRKVVNFLDRKIGIKVAHQIRFVLEGRDFIKMKSEQTSDDISGLFYRENDKFEIYVLYGLRAKDLYQVLPHEIAHAWMAENCRTEPSPVEIEGFAQWAAYHTLKEFGYGDYRKNLLEGETVYARGLRQMLEIERTGGIKAVLEHFRQY